MKTDTPETDALLFTINEGRTYETEGPIEELARRLERERNEARRKAEDLRDEYHGTIFFLGRIMRSVDDEPKRIH